MSNDSQSYPGARWWKFDFHTHTPASSDYGAGPDQKSHKALTARDWLQNFITAGIDCIAITDHHCGDWIDELKAEQLKMQEEGMPGAGKLYLFPGVELSIAGIHYLAIFGKEASTQTINDLLARARYDKNPNNAQGICNELDPVKVCETVSELGGLFFPAHVDLKNSGLFRSTQTGHVRPIFNCKAFIACEIAGPGYQMPQIYTDHQVNWTSILGSDSHHPAPNTVGGGRYPGSHYTWVKMGEPSLETLRLALLDGNGSGVQRSDEISPDSNLNTAPELWIESLEVNNARFMGKPTPIRFDFSPWLNSIIGGRGSGKSTLIHFIRLTGKREGELTQLPQKSRVREGFENFTQIGHGLEAQSESTLVYRKGDERYRLLWKNSDRGTTVENWDSILGEWFAENSQEVTTRFPMTIFGQDQIGTLAENSQAILQRIDEAIDKPGWLSRWNNELETFLKHLSEVRRLRDQLGEKDRLNGQLTDLTKKLAVFESSAHASILKSARRSQRQQTEFHSLIEAHNDKASSLEDFIENFLLYDLPPDLIDPTAPEQNILTDAESKLRTSVTEAASKLVQIAADLRKVNDDATQMLTNSDWEKARLRSAEDYDTLVNELKKRGVDNPNEYSTLMGQKQAVENGLKALGALEKTIESHTEKAEASRNCLLKLRQELQQMRQSFLAENLAENPFVRIALVPYGTLDDIELAERTLRSFLGCEDNQFSSSILSDDKQFGILGGLYRELPNGNAETKRMEIERRLSEWKSMVLISAKVGGPDLDLAKPFATFLQRSYEVNPEAILRLQSWWPEDSLEVSYSKGGEGRNFTPLANGSAGEKAAALLAFFLAYGESPLVIDQPENDLDNHLITDLVVKQLQNNKSRRQIIVVTHNPNIVVNGDAEMVHAMKFMNGQCRPFAQGALQDSKVRDEVCAVMEGGERALEKRYQRLIS